MSHRSSLQSSIGLLLAGFLLAAVALATRAGQVPAAPGAPAAPVAAQDSGVTVEFLGHSHYRLTSPSGKVILTNPFVTNNAESATTLDEVIARGADLILVADGHGDEVGDTVPIAKATGARVVAPFELAGWMVATQEVPAGQVIASNPGSLHRVDGITVYVVNAIHGGGIQMAPGERRVYGGPAVGFVIAFENGYSLYFSGSSAATTDMTLWGDLYKPDGAILHQSAAHDPKDAALVAKLIGTNNPNLKTVFPHHHRLQLRPGELFRAADLRAEIENLGIVVTFVDPEPRRVYTLSK